METRQILESSVVGVKWSLGLSLVVVPLSYGTNIILGRISPEALGTYGLLAVLSSAIATFFLFGGNQVVVRFLPELTPEKAGAFLFSYTVLAFAVAAVILSLVLPNPAALAYLTRSEINAWLPPYLLVLVPIVLLQQISLAALQARMELKWMSIISKLVPVLSFFCFLALMLLLKGYFTQYMFLTVITVVIGTNVMSLVLAIYQVWTKVIKPMGLRLQVLFPPGFWYFATMIHLSTIVIFTLDNFDQAFVVSHFDLTELGLYRASLVTAQFVRWIPLVLTQTMLPLFSNLLANQEEQHLRLVYNRITRYSMLATSGVALTLILFSQQILSFFGPAYTGSSSILIILSSVFVLSAISTVNSSMIVATGRVGWGIASGLIGSMAQIFLSFMLVGRLGLSGIAIAKVSNLLCITILNALFLLWAFSLKPEGKVIVILALDLIVILLAQWIVLPTLSLVVVRNLFLLAGFGYVIWRLDVITRADWQFLVSMVSVRAF